DVPPYLAGIRNARLISHYIWAITTPIPNEPYICELTGGDTIGTGYYPLEASCKQHNCAPGIGAS
ncbi:MAG: hypothetical protein Q7U34_05515, partial [Anaerolineales bacterium]|nr:hypothetical protein [Anaerolineales bacterium]